MDNVCRWGRQGRQGEVWQSRWRRGRATIAARRGGAAVPLAILAFVTALAPGLAPAQTPATSGAAGPETREPTWVRQSGTRVALFPAGNVYPVYVADPHRATNAILERFYTRTDIPDAESPRTQMSVGGSFGMLRVDTASGRSWQVSIDCGLDTLFDAQHKLDAIGWDGNYGLTVETASRGPLSLRVGLFHVSGHLGDEYAVRNGLERREYTREEIAFGAAWRFGRAWRVYGETAFAWWLLGEQQEPWRAQGGVEWEGTPRLWGGRFAWYGAADLAAMQERGWRLDAAIEGGIVTRASGRAYRLLIQYYDGRPTLGEFYPYHEAHLTLGIKMDL
jgi:hypothetical protein